LLPDAVALTQLVAANPEESWARGVTCVESQLMWPSEPLHTLLLRVLSKLQAAHFAAKYPAVRDTMLRSLIELVVTYYRTLAGEKVCLCVCKHACLWREHLGG
jgi:hypothetical protein